ncbi:transcription factor bHLH30 [Cajanus cajan]|uniref:Transcription factor bHLH30 n=1 Tax=Cajanus cajan TaxID=3821 RepID=A0A151RXH0_CAJCA|nr:transcription factor bHLH30 [Cajanus cajan]KYP47255.1 Transcription factor bHLH30 [Cajanus cajan]
MLPFRRFYGFESWLDHHSSASLIKKAVQLESDRSKSTEACKSHREAERRRRQRINAHLSTLRSLLPNAAKSDKASLLGEVVEHVKRLRKEADDVARGDDPASPQPFPGESDEATVSCCDGEGRLRATLCCQDRPGLHRDLSQAIRAVRARAVRAEMMTVGGRTKSVVVMEWPEGEGGGAKEEVGALERALKAVMENRALVGFGMGPVVLGQKRARDSYGSPSTEVDSASAFFFRNGGVC